MNSNIKHTKGEWYLNNSKDDYGGIIIKENPEYGNEKYFAIAIKHSYDFVGFYYPHSKQTDEEMIANAKLIVTSVNNHSKLIEALKEIRLAWMEIDDIPFWKKHSEKFAKAFELLQSIEQQTK